MKTLLTVMLLFVGSLAMAQDKIEEPTLEYSDEAPASTIDESALTQRVDDLTKVVNTHTDQIAKLDERLKVLESGGTTLSSMNPGTAPSGSYLSSGASNYLSTTLNSPGTVRGSESHGSRTSVSYGPATVSYGPVTTSYSQPVQSQPMQQVQMAPIVQAAPMQMVAAPMVSAAPRLAAAPLPAPTRHTQPVQMNAIVETRTLGYEANNCPNGNCATYSNLSSRPRLGSRVGNFLGFRRR